MSENQSQPEVYYSTGRGGHANMTKSLSPDLKPATSNMSNLTTSFSHDKEGKVIYSTGRGGAANMAHSNDIPEEPALVPQVSPTPLQPVYSTGRGGHGNIARNTNMDQSLEGDDNKGKSLVQKLRNIFK
ncbi:hypothetical protein PACTADRAFT_4559 [Pachysolen tannophilus NRRL Y-2460]|uniref:Uncharacterized protein n=1 Tax=Pachysolen tannophilus NRRL Y-2460 TaxID=669874 RepID=A0A1E4TPG5_PACTA|nr:hypothetical protein PACTADRAFT_4559 [Pachysolen tannophilus NRRL Y-2460]